MIQPIPAIDLLGGKCVRLLRGRYDQVTVYDDDPVRVALHWERLGAQWLHIVDLDAARSGGDINNADLIARMCEALAIPAQTGGGLRTLNDIEHALRTGVHRAILGTAAVRNPGMITEAVATFGASRVILGIDAKDNEVRVQGWTEGSTLDATAFAREMEGRGVQRIIYTDIHRDGTMHGPNLEAYRTLGRALTQCRITASGGIAAYDDVEALTALSADGVDSVVIGRALYEGAIDPKQLWP